MPKFAFSDPDTMVQAGLIDDFDGVITSARYVPWNYQGNRQQYSLAVLLRIHADDGTEVEQYYSAGDLKQWVPCNDLVNGTPAGATLDDYLTLAKGEGQFDPSEQKNYEGVIVVAGPGNSQEGLPNSSNWAHFVGVALDAGFEKTRLSKTLNEGFDGLRAHFKRIPQKTRTGMATRGGEGGEGDRQKTILVMTQVLGQGQAQAPGVKSTVTPTVTPTPVVAAQPVVQAAPAPSAGDIDARIEQMILTVLGEAGGNPVNKAILPGKVMATFAGDQAAIGAAMVKVTNHAYLGGFQSFSYDPSTGNLKFPG